MTETIVITMRKCIARRLKKMKLASIEFYYLYGTQITSFFDTLHNTQNAVFMIVTRNSSLYYNYITQNTYIVFFPNMGVGVYYDQKGEVFNIQFHRCFTLLLGKMFMY